MTKSTALKSLTIAAVMASVSVSGAQATLLSGDLTVDDFFTAYISTNDSVLGTPIASGNFWPTVVSFSGVALTPFVTNYLHIIAQDNTGPQMFIGDFTLNDANFQFGNGTQHLASDTTNWRASPGIAWAAPSGTPQSFGANGCCIWGLLSGIDNAALHIWDSGSLDDPDSTLISTTISYIGPPRDGNSVPEPGTLSLLGFGLLGFGAIRRRWKAS